jgi:hypothetical protein
MCLAPCLKELGFIRGFSVCTYWAKSQYVNKNAEILLFTSKNVGVQVNVK